MIRVSILYDNTVCASGLEGDWGFAAYVESPERRVLFDAGGDGEILLSNASAMGINMSVVDTIFISHNHFDHIGGLAAAIRACPGAHVFVPASLRGVKRAAEVVSVTGAIDIGDGYFSTGELDGVEQSLLFRSPAGIVVVAGCSHPGLEKIIKTAGNMGHVHAVMGGFHGFDRFDVLQDVDFVCPTHCTSHIARIASLFPERYLPGGVGRIYEFPMKKSHIL